MKNTLLLMTVIVLGWMTGCQEPPLLAPVETKAPAHLKDLSYRQIYRVDLVPRQLIGYLEENVVTFAGSDASYRIYYVKNTLLQKVGFVMYDGATYRYTPQGGTISLGNFSLDLAVQQIMDFKGHVVFEEFNPIYIFE